MLKLICHWKDIPGYPGYKISEDGLVWSSKRNILIAKARNYAGYHVVTITDANGFRAPRKVHRLVYSAYVGPLEDGKVIDHIDNNINNNHYKNLQQITPSENSIKSFITGKNKDYVAWDRKTVEKICKWLSKGLSNKNIYKMLKLSRKEDKEKCSRLIWDILHGTRHQSIAQRYDFMKRSSENNPSIKICSKEVVEIYKTLQNSDDLQSIAKKYNVTTACVKRIRSKQSWKWVTDKIDMHKTSTTISQESTV